MLVDAPVGGASHDNLSPSDHEDEPLIELVTREVRSASKQRLT